MSDLPAPELVIFDVDGTLHDTFQWWGPVIRAGVARFAELTGIDLDVPDDDFAARVVGMKDAGVWAPFLPEEHKHRWADLRATVLPMEVAEISSGRDYLFAGVRELLLHIRKLGVRVALASNCRSAYMAGVRDGQRLAELTDWQFCLDSGGGCDKAGMLRMAMAAAETRRAVMVGDREPDHEAAVEVGLPFVWRANERCEIRGADAVWNGDPDELLGTLGLPGISWGTAE